LLFEGGACYLLSGRWARSVEGLLRERVASRTAWGEGAERKITTENTEFRGVSGTNPVFSV
jgi:hypothetical protein